MKFTKIKKVKTPTQRMGDAGIDFYVPNGFTVLLNPGEGILIPSGIKVVVPINHVLVAFNKSGVSTKKGLIVGACVIDSGYRGEVHIHLININKNKVVSINPGDKIIQFILLPYVHGYMEEIDTDNYVKNYDYTDRGSGGFGSTGNS